jgi:lysophospholipase L1-like esterase
MSNRTIHHACAAIALILMTLAAAVTATAEEQAKSLPRVLIIGDSISIGYNEPVTELLQGKAQVEHNPGNAAHTGKGLENIDAWLGDVKWDVIHFNFGLHDFKYVGDDGKNATTRETGHIQIPLEEYKSNLEAIVERLKKTGAKLIFATTTPFPAELTHSVRDPKDCDAYNAAAVAIMKKHEIAIDDLYALAASQLDKIQNPKDVHFTKDGSKALAAQVATSIEQALK